MALADPKKWRILEETCYYCEAPPGEVCWNTSGNILNGTADNPILHYYEPNPTPGPHRHPKRVIGPPPPPPTFEQAWLSTTGKTWEACRDDHTVMAKVPVTLRAQLMLLWSTQVRDKVKQLPPMGPRVYCQTDED